MSQLFEELVLPFVQSHGAACSVLLGTEQPEEIGEEAARELLWPVRGMEFRDFQGGALDLEDCSAIFTQ
jgi:hypothetical protein